MVFVAQFSPAYSHNQTTITTAAHQLFNLIIIFCLLSLTLLIIPYFFLFTSFFTGINQIAKAKNFHLFMILFLAIVTVILLVVGCLVISYLAYSFRL